MRATTLAALLLAIILILLVSGCGGRKLRKSANAGQSAVTFLATLEAPRMYHVAGAALMVFGVAVVAFRGMATGGTLFAGGAAIALFGAVLQNHRWFPLAAIITLGLLVAATKYESYRLRKGGQVVALGVEKSGFKEQVTEAIKEQGEGPRADADYLVKPEKKRLKVAGKL